MESSLNVLAAMELAVIGLVLAFGSALANWFVIWKGYRRWEYLFKPLTLVLLVIATWFLAQGPHDPWQAQFFLPALAFSLLGDILLLPGDRYFVGGLVAFLLAHILYIVGFNETLPKGMWLPLALIVVLVAGFLVRRIVAGLQEHGQSKLVPPVIVYGVALGLMLLSGWATLFRPEWSPTRQLLAVTGATLFFISDATLAWNQFVKPVLRGHLIVMITYHLAQFALALSIAL